MRLIDAVVNQTINFTFVAEQGLMQKNVTYLLDGQPWDGTVWAYIDVKGFLAPGTLIYEPGMVDSSLSFNDTGVATLPSWNVFNEVMHTVNFTITFHQAMQYGVGDNLGWAVISPISSSDQGMCARININVVAPTPTATTVPVPE